ncbi:hypothetical protein [Colwellia sp. MEBiC06753]
MVLVLIVAAIFVVVSIYFYFRSERLQHELVGQRRETAQMRKENRLFADIFAVVAAKQEEFLEFRFNKLKERAEKSAPTVVSDLTLISPLITNYATIFRACASGKTQLKTISEQCLESYRVGSFKEFQRFISGQEKYIKRMWANNNLNGYMSMIEALLTEKQKELARINQANKANNDIMADFKKF